MPRVCRCVFSTSTGKSQGFLEEERKAESGLAESCFKNSVFILIEVGLIDWLALGAPIKSMISIMGTASSIPTTENRVRGNSAS